MQSRIRPNDSGRNIFLNALLAFISLFFNGFGVFLTIHASIGAGPWDVFSLGLSKTLSILYGTASIASSAAILAIDIAMREPIGIAMFIDALTVGKSVDLFNYLGFIPVPETLAGSIVMILAGLTVMGYTQCFYMRASLGCGPRDTLLVGLSKRIRRVPIGAVSIALLSLATFVGWLLGGPVGIGTILCAFCSGPIMQLAFRTLNFDATGVHHQSLRESAKVLIS
ncbi:MAG: hypothetical protein Q4E35_06305 [Eubacteriales bacterium]|nr:hypothetical protein [Eubacteriales bacterium]